MKHLEFGRTLCLLKDILVQLESEETDGNVEPKLVAKAYEIIDRNEKTANDYIEYTVNYMNEKLSKKGTIPFPFDEEDAWEESGFYKKLEKTDGGKKYD